MHKLEQIAEQIRQMFDAQTAARDQALEQARALTRHCALAIRAVHRSESGRMQEHLDEARRLASELRSGLAHYPDLFYAGYTQDALKEYVEASITCALLQGKTLPGLEDLEIPHFTYLNGLAESVGEIRRRILDIMRHGYSEEVELLLNHMDEIYAVLVTMDYPDSITNGLRRQTDIIRSILERTRGDVNFSLQSEHLTRAITRLSDQLPGPKSHPDKANKPALPPAED